MPTTEDHEPDPFEGLVLDDDFVRAATVTEASGRSRMLAARWKRQPPVEPEPWRPPTDLKTYRRKRRLKQLWWVPVSVVLVGSLVFAMLKTGGLHPTAAAHHPVGTETAKPTAAPPTQDPETPTPDRPWAGSPAVDWPAGADGIAPPQAQAVGVFSQDDVVAQLKLVKDYLVAANLDPKVIAGGDPGAALDMLGGETRATAEKDIAHPSENTGEEWWFSRFDPRTAVQVGTEVKVQGRMAFESDGEKGVLVHTDYTYVYALRPGPDAFKTLSSSTGSSAKPVSWTLTPADVPGSAFQVRRTIIRHELDFRFYDPAHFKVDTKKLYIDKQSSNGGDTGCDLSDGFFHPGFADGANNGPDASPGAPTEDPYDRSKELPEAAGGCHHGTRS